MIFEFLRVPNTLLWVIELDHQVSDTIPITPQIGTLTMFPDFGQTFLVEFGLEQNLAADLLTPVQSPRRKIGCY